VTPLEPATADAVQRALAAEHAAVWALELVTAFLPDALDAAAGEALTAHRARRDTASRYLRDHEVSPVTAEPAYAAPPVTDQASALALLVIVETDCAAAWRSAIEHTDDAAARSLAAQALTDAAVRGARWRRSAGVTPVTVPFPGAPAP
jgi:Domain of unknown function (DUF4439)